MKIDDGLKMEKYEEIQNENELVLKKFEAYLNKKGTSKKEIAKHLDNIHLLINDYLAIDWEVEPTELDASFLKLFLDWCIDKWIFNTSSGLASALNSVKIFYNYLNENNKIKDINKILSICENKEDYIKEFNSHESLLGEY